MKRNFGLFTVGLAVMLSLGQFASKAQVEVSASFQIHAAWDFYDPLATYGSWVALPSYGRCWRPVRIATTEVRDVVAIVPL
jgi:hypothetical protein